MSAVVIVIILSTLPWTAVANDLFDQGAEAFLFNRPQEAATLMEQVLQRDPVNARAYLYLAMSYEQLEQYERAIATLKRSESVPGIDRGRVLFNLGNNYLHLGEAEQAAAAYTQAIEANPLGANAFLNRANVRVTLELYDEAVADYLAVLGLAPDHPQRESIERMIALLRQHIEEERFRAEQ